MLEQNVLVIVEHSYVANKHQQDKNEIAQTVKGGLITSMVNSLVVMACIYVVCYKILTY